MLIDWFTVGAQALNFLILVWLMRRFLYKPILNAIDAREKRIAKELADADAKKAEAGKERDAFQKKNEDFDRQRGELLGKAQEEAKSERRKLKKTEKSLAGFSLLLGLDNSKLVGPAPQVSHHTIYFPTDYDTEFDEIFTKKIPVTDPTIYICAPRDPLMVKREGTESWFVLVNAPRHDPESGWDWSKGGAQYAQKILDKLDSLGLRVSERLDVMEFRTPLDLQNATNAPGGSIYGTSSNGAMSAFSRAKNRSPVKGLYCVGGSAHPGGGLPLVGMSAELVANAIGSAEPVMPAAHHHH